MGGLLAGEPPLFPHLRGLITTAKLLGPQKERARHFSFVEEKSSGFLLTIASDKEMLVMA
jgi:hypothetical protein